MEIWIAVGVGAFNALLLLVLLRRSSGNDEAATLAMQQSLHSMHDKLERIERELRTEITESSRGAHTKLSAVSAKPGSATHTGSKNHQ